MNRVRAYHGLLMLAALCGGAGGAEPVARGRFTNIRWAGYDPATRRPTWEIKGKSAESSGPHTFLVAGPTIILYRKRGKSLEKDTVFVARTAVYDLKKQVVKLEKDVVVTVYEPAGGRLVLKTDRIEWDQAKSRARTDAPVAVTRGPMTTHGIGLVVDCAAEDGGHRVRTIRLKKDVRTTLPGPNNTVLTIQCAGQMLMNREANQVIYRKDVLARRDQLELRGNQFILDLLPQPKEPAATSDPLSQTIRLMTMRGDPATSYDGRTRGSARIIRVKEGGQRLEWEGDAKMELGPPPPD